MKHSFDQWREMWLVNDPSYLLLVYLCVSLDYTLIGMALASDHTGWRHKLWPFSLMGLLLWAICCKALLWSSTDFVRSTSWLKLCRQEGQMYTRHRYLILSGLLVIAAPFVGALCQMLGSWWQINFILSTNIWLFSASSVENTSLWTLSFDRKIIYI